MSSQTGDETSVDIWVEKLNNAATNLRAGSYAFGDIQLYMGLMRGTNEDSTFCTKNILTIYPDKLALTTPETIMSISKNTRMEAVNDKKGRFTIINPTSVPKESSYVS